MKNIFSILTQAIRMRFIKIFTYVRLITNPSWWKTKGFIHLRKFFTSLLDIKPKHEKDYYTLFGWMVSKKLAFSLVVVIGVLSLMYIFMMSPVLTTVEGLFSSDTIRTYKYDDFPLKFHEGFVQVLNSDDNVAYVGNVADNGANGEGTLYDKEGNLVYNGMFANSMFNGLGTQYYPDGTIMYIGSFTDNLYNGEGEKNRPNGIKEYEGEYTAGLKNGSGKLYNATGSPAFEGNFLKDNIIYEEFVGKTSAEVATMYLDTPKVYSDDDEYCVQMDEISAVYSVQNGENSVEGEWTVDQVYVVANSIILSENPLKTMAEISSELGKPEYYGKTAINLAETVGTDFALKTEFAPDVLVEIESENVFDEVLNVTNYSDTEVYIYTFIANELFYTFYCEDSNSGFYMYSISESTAE